MQINSIQSHNNVSFKAKIFKTECLKEALNYSKLSTNIDEKNEFYNALSMIFHDNKLKSFQIKEVKDKFTQKSLNKYKFHINKKVNNSLTYEINKELSPALNCINAIKHFIFKNYGKKKLNTLKTPRLNHVKKYQNLVQTTLPTTGNLEQISKQKKLANMEIDKQIDVIMLQSRFGLTGE